MANTKPVHTAVVALGVHPVLPCWNAASGPLQKSDWLTLWPMQSADWLSPFVFPATAKTRLSVDKNHIDGATEQSQ